MVLISSKLRSAIIAPLLALLVVTVYSCPAVAAEAIIFLRPETDKSEDSATLSPSFAESEAYIRRSGEVVFTAKDLFAPESILGREAIRAPEALSQQELQFSFFPGQDIRIAVDSESETASGILSFTGRRSSAALSTFSMTITRDRYLITFQDLDSGMTYKVVGDMDTGKGRVTEYDLAKLPPVIDNSPIIPPQE